MRNKNKILAITTVILMSLFLVYLNTPNFIRQIGLPEIAKNLPSDTIGANEEFSQRISVKYPEGTDISALVSELEEFGFISLENQFVAPNQGYYYISRSCGFLCDHVWVIEWQNTDDGKLIEIKGTFTENRV